MEYSPPPFFKQGPSARARLIFFSVFAITLLVADARFNALSTIRRILGATLYPIQRGVLLPGDWLADASRYFTSTEKLEEENAGLVREKTQLAQNGLLSQELLAENTQLRKLLGARARQQSKSISTEILYDARDPSSRRVVIDRGSGDGITPGLPVIDDSGVVGQVTRVFPLLSEVTLLTDKSQVIPVQNLRSGLRSVATGGSEGGLLNLRFMAANADVKIGDTLVTSGIDGVYPAGLPVARIVQIEHGAAFAFATILCEPIGGVDRNRYLLVLLPEPLPEAPPPPEPTPEQRHIRRPAH
ncbi:MAG: rod shape-determining protein MreC [Burkholderiaceae bacterium]|jgi:rod shape-determining protein MreC